MRGLKRRLHATRTPLLTTLESSPPSRDPVVQPPRLPDASQPSARADARPPQPPPNADARPTLPVPGAARFVARLVPATVAGHLPLGYLRLGGMIVAWLLTLATVLNIGHQEPTASHWLLLALASVLLTLAVPAAPPALLRARAPGVARGRRLRAGIAVVALGCVVAAIGGSNGYQNWDYIFGPGLLDYAAGAVLV